MLVISNWPCALRSSNFEITPAITPWIALHSVQLLLLSWSKTRSGKSHDYSDNLFLKNSVFKMLEFSKSSMKWNEPPFLNSFGIVWTVLGKINFSNSNVLISTLFCWSLLLLSFSTYCQFLNSCYKKDLLLLFGTSFIRSLNSKLASLWNAREHGRALRNALSSSGESSAEKITS